jgi:hypothetical protein
VDASSPLNLRRYLVDFEAAVISEIRAVFGSGVSVAGCHVHLKRNLRRRLQEIKFLQTLALTNVRFSFFVSAIACLAYVPVAEVPDYYKALVHKELPKVLEDVREQLEAEEDEVDEKFDDIQRSIDIFLDYVETTYVGKVSVKTCRVWRYLRPGPDLFL